MLTWPYLTIRGYNRYSARTLVHRIPEEIKKQASQLATLIQIMELMRQWERQNGNLKDIYALLHQSRWDSALAPLIAVLQGKGREKRGVDPRLTFFLSGIQWCTNMNYLWGDLTVDSIQDRELDILAKAYTSLPVQLAASRIWLQEDTAAERMLDILTPPLEYVLT